MAVYADITAVSAKKIIRNRYMKNKKVIVFQLFFLLSNCFFVINIQL